ncbi:MAG TPA: glycosyltransferase family 2 protein [Pseudogracilibacillus sp.]|nr:glycosyltransferase family 2 protein [Pseudogracilibacillus sp.]
MNNKPLVSIVTPTYNSEVFIEETIQSILNQSYMNWELLIVDDCSTDNTVDIIKRYTDERIKLHILEENSGAAVARNHAIKKATGKYLAFLDSDDLWTKEKLEQQVRFMQKNDLPFSFTGYELMNEEGNLLNKYVPVPYVMTYKSLLKNTIIGCLTVMLDREKIGEQYMPNIRAGQDTAFWLQLLKKGFTAYGINEPLAHYRIGSHSISSNKWKALQRTWRIYREIEELSILKSSWYFTQYSLNALKKRL